MLKGSRVGWTKGKIVPFLPTAEYYFNKGIEAFDRYDMNKSKKYLSRALELEPEESMIACQLALVYTETGEYTESNKLLLKVLEDMDETMSECHYFLANNYAHLGLFAESHKHAKIYLDLDEMGEFKDDAEELMDMIGLISENFEVSIENDEILSIQEESKLLLEDGKFQDAVDMLEKAVNQHPDFWPAYNNLALAYFYEGDIGKALGALEKVLDANPGNLHALCNLAVFLHYERQTEQLESLLQALEKVKPISYEHQFKLGATFALTGRYEIAYYWLRSVKKFGYDEDASYYYWLAKSAFHLGYEKVADAAWKQLVLIDPKKADQKPWQEPSDIQLGDEDEVIFRLLKSQRLEERLYGLFLISISNRKRQLIIHDDFKPIEEFSLLEKLYLSFILDSDYNGRIDTEALIEKGHKVSVILHDRYNKNNRKSKGILIAWYAAFIRGLKMNESYNNTTAFAAATEYIWLKQRNNKISQKEIAEQYMISISTLSKYIKILEGYWK